jgi:quercetin dioxygenase-like cupin family protein
MAAVAVKAKKVKAANSLVAGAPAAPSSRVTYFDSEAVAAAAALTPPGKLYYGDKEGDKQIYEVGFSGGDKESPQIQTFTHVFYVQQGDATLVTGGTLLDPKPTTPTQFRGTALEGGEAHHLSKGDVIIVPAGTPHGWKDFSQNPRLVYFVVNVKVHEADSLGAGAPPPASSSRVAYFDKETVAAALASRGKLYFGDKEGDEKIYEVGFSGWDKQGPSQIHPFTHVIYVLQGTAILVTGGTMVDPKPHFSREIQSPNGTAGTAIEGGETYHLAKGDVIIVPSGVPHWWKEVPDAPFIYFVVNIR